MGVVVIFIITTSDNWLDCIFLQLPLGPCRNCFRRCWKLLRIQIRKSRFYPSSHLTCEVLWTGPAPVFLLIAIPHLGNEEWLRCSVLVSGAL